MDYRYLVKQRVGERKLGEDVFFYDEGKSFSDYADEGVQFALVGIPESVGVRGNSGSGGAEHAWEAFLVSFLNMQNNGFLEGCRILCVEVSGVRAIQKASVKPEALGSLETLRTMCANIDGLVYEVLKGVIKAGIVPIVIGGGHNNVYPILKAIYEGGSLHKVHCVNCDFHADFRALEGRHSGNGFSYAREEGILAKYLIFGLNKFYNSAKMLKQLSEDKGISYLFFDELEHMPSAVDQVLHYFAGCEGGLGLDIDMDCIANMPASAFTPVGFQLSEIGYFIKRIVSWRKPVYLHLPEAAPKTLKEEVVVGKSLAYLVATFIDTYQI